MKSVASIFTWDSVFETGLGPIDEQHHRLIALINDLGQAAIGPTPADQATVTASIKALEDYARHHFSAEEQLMSEYALDDTFVAMHRHSHERFLDEATSQINVDGQSAESSLTSLVNYLVQWLAYHILSVDLCMARQIEAIRAGLSPQQARAQECSDRDQNIEPLVRALKALMFELSQRNIELLATNQRLEEMVRARTSELEAANRELVEQSTHDELTGLPNRRYAMDALRRACLEAMRYDQPLSLVMVDADDFKQVNDTFGHDAGDDVLRLLATRLTAAVRTSDRVCRLGGDEFLIICPHTPQNGAEEIGRKILAAPAGDATSPAVRRWSGSISVGIASWNPDFGSDYGRLLKAADQALYRAKQAEKGILSIYDGATTDG